MKQATKKTKHEPVTMEAIDSRFNSFIGRILDRIELTESVLRQEMNERFNKVNERFEEVDQRFDKVDQRFDEVREKINGVEQQMDRLDQKIDKVDFSWRVALSTVEGNLSKKIDTAVAPIGETLQRHEREIAQLKDAAHH